MDFEYAQKVIDDYVDNYNNVRLHSAIGYITPYDMLNGRAPAIQAERCQKLKEARERRRLAFLKNRGSLSAHCKTEDGSAGEQPPRDSSATTTASTVPAGNAAGVPKATVSAG